MSQHPPVAPISLDSAIAKAMRAEQHLVALNEALGRWLGSQPYILMTSHPKASPKQDVAEVEVRVLSVERVPDEVGAMLGDVLSNLRSALDHVAWHAVCRRLGREPTDEEDAGRIYFPIASKPERFDRHPTVRLVSEGLADLMRDYQPFRDNDLPGAKHLDVLRDLSNIDKHRALHAAVGALLDDPGLGVVVEGARCVGVIPGQRILVRGALVTTIEVATESLGPDSNVGVQSLPVEILFGDREDVSFEFISEMRSTVNLIISGAADLLREDP